MKTQCNPVRLGWIGAGSTLNNLYGPALKFLPRLAVAAVADPDPVAAEASCKRFGIPRHYPDVKAMLSQESLDAVIVASPVFMHEEHVRMAAEAGLHVLCQKPMAPTVSEAENMIAACQSAGVILLMTLNRRCSPPHWTLTQMVKEGVIGEPFAVECIWTSWTAGGSCGWRDSERCLGGNFQDHASHTFDLSSLWLGPLESVQAQAYCLGSRIGQPRGVEDHMSALVSHAGGKSSVHIHSRSSHRPVSEIYRIYGATGTLETEYTGGWSAFSHDSWDLRLFRDGNVRFEKPASRRPDYEYKDQMSDTTYAFWWELKNFVDAVADGNHQAQPDGQAGLASVKAVSASFLSALENRVVPLSQGSAFDAAAHQRLLQKMTH